MKGFFNTLNAKDVYEKLLLKYEMRLKKEKQRQMEEGNIKNKPLLYRIDRILEYSGIRKRISFINAEIFIFFLVIILIFVFMLFSLLFQNILGGFIADIAFFIILYFALYVLSGRYYNSLEENIMTLLNLVENFNKSQDDIVGIFRKTIPYIGEPIKTILTDFCTEAQMYGDINQAFDNMNAKIEHRKIKELIHNLKVCSRYESNYDMVIRDCRMSMINYLEIKSERKAIINNGRAEIVILFLCAAFIIYLFSKIISGSLMDLLLGSIVGNIIIIYCMIVNVISVVIMFSYDKRGGE